MKFAICNEIFESNALPQAYEFARRIGYTGLEVAPFTLGPRPTELTQKERHEFRQLVVDSGLDLVGLHWLLAKTEGYHLTTNETTVRAKTAEYLKKLVHLCGDLGGQIMVLGSPLQRNFAAPQTHADAAKNAADVLAEITADLAERNVTLAIEPLGPAEGNFLNQASQAVDLIKEVNSPNIKLHLDVKAMSSEAAPAEEIILANSNYLAHFHANDPNLLGPGMGAFDQRPVFKALQQIDYQGWVSVEVFDFSLGYEAILQQSMDGIQRACVA